ncbi:MAG: ATP-binding cassette domain-containing protein [Candidatus Bathyarchaeum tardum]|nr:MAG: ATP-binding cassette domain-containing protein [Candidatus Bathyarchaeum tardum]
MENNVMIEVNNLTKKFGDFTAVDHISFEVKKSEIFGLLGPNGAGKTTTIRMLSTLTRPSEGTATIGGYDIVKKDNKVRQLIGLVSEKMIMYDRLTAKENLKFFGKLYDLPKKTMNQRIDELLELVQLTKFKDAKVGNFSTGMRQRMNVVRALLNRPQVLFLDEPTLGLDPQSTVEIREFIRKINKENETTIILTTHMMNEADLLCDRIGIVDHGKITALDTSKNLKKLVSGDNTTVLKLDVANLTPKLVTKIKAVQCVKSVSQDTETHLKVHATGDTAFDDILGVLQLNNAKINSIENVQPTLEDVFLQITGRDMRDKADNKMPSPRQGPNRVQNRIR